MTAADVLTLRQLNRATLARQMLLAREAIAVPRAIDRLLAIQAQWAKPPFFALWSRLEGFAREDLARALRERKIVRATFARATLHLLGAKDFVRLRPAVQPVLTRAMHTILRVRGEGLDPTHLADLARAYLDRGPRTFTELRAHLTKQMPAGLDERAMGYMVRTTLPLVQVPIDADWSFPTDPSFALAESWLGETIALDETEPEALVLRYLSAMGPASIADIQAWTGLQQLRGAVDALRPKLVVFRDEKKKELFDLPKAPRPDAGVDAPVRFLPEFDNAIVARTDARFLATKDRAKVFLPGLRVLATFLVDGLVAGTWKIERKKDAAAIVLAPFGALPKKARGAVDEEASALIRFAEPDASTFDVRYAKG